MKANTFKLVMYSHVELLHFVSSISEYAEYVHGLWQSILHGHLFSSVGLG